MIQVVKRDGRKEALNIEKFHKVVFHACEGIAGVSPSEVEIKSQIQFYDGMTTSEIQETLIKAASDLISAETPNYQYVGGRLINYGLRKEVYNQYEPCHVKELVERNIKSGFYDPELITYYDDKEWDKINSFIKHSRDENLTYVAMEQLRGKYLVQNRVTGAIFETPQMCYVLIAATLFAQYPKEERLRWVKDYYDAISNHDISLPTPVMAGVRTPQRQFSSCVLIEAGDSLDSINATTAAVVKYVSQKAGIGIGAGSIRAIGSPIRKGDAYHTGVIPFYKLFQSATKSCSQGGVRGGAATIYYPVWHLEVQDLLVLKNNKGTEDNRVRHMDYGVQFNKLFYERLISGGTITLFSPSDVPGLYDTFFADQVKFRELYEKAEKNSKIRKKVVSAVELFSSFMEERKNTGRVYLQNVDNANDHGSFIPELAPVRQSNLCVTGDTEIDVLVDGNKIDRIGIKEAIEMLSQHDVEVLSKDLESGVKSYKKITNGAMTAKKAELMEIEDEATGKIVRCTPDHQIYTSNRGWVMAKELVEDDALDAIAEPSNSDAKTKIRKLDHVEDVYDITVQDNHNFYANGILIHNCAEITLPAKPLNDINDPSGEISLCTLSAINWGNFKQPKDMQRACELAVRGLDALLSYQNYPVLAAQLSTEKRRPLGVGIINFAFWMAKNDLTYQNITPEGLQLIDEWTEAWSYYLIKASADLAAEQGAIPGLMETKYGHGITPNQTYKKELDELIPHVERMDWAGLREQLKDTGIRNSTLMALMPSETSSQCANATNGIEPPRSLISVKQSKHGVLKQVVPQYHHLKNKYDLLWDQKSPQGYLKIVSVLQKYVDQGISVNTSYNPQFFEDEKIPMSVLLQDLLMFYRYGGKQLYYFNTYDGQDEVDVSKMLNEPLEQSEIDEEDCESCKI